MLYHVVDIAAEGPLEEFEDTKGVIRISISMKYRQHNGQKKKYKRTNNDPQNIPIKLKIEVVRPLVVAFDVCYTTWLILLRRDYLSPFNTINLISSRM